MEGQTAQPLPKNQLHPALLEPQGCRFPAESQATSPLSDFQERKVSSHTLLPRWEGGDPQMDSECRDLTPRSLDASFLFGPCHYVWLGLCHLPLE